MISRRTIPGLKADVIAGSSNNQLLRHEDAIDLKDRGILYAPDYVINAGGLINVAAEIAPGGYDKEDVTARIAEIPKTLATIFERADEENRPTNEIALSMAKARMETE